MRITGYAYRFLWSNFWNHSCSSDNEKMQGKTTIILILLVILCGCSNNRQVSCIYENGEKKINLDIHAINDDISSVSVRTSFDVPYNVILDNDKYSFLLSQLDSTNHFEDNHLISEYALALDSKYSLDLTLKDLKTKRFVCE